MFASEYSIIDEKKGAESESLQHPWVRADGMRLLLGSAGFAKCNHVGRGS